MFKVVQLDDGSITVDAPASAFPDSGYFTLYDKAASAKGACLRTLCGIAASRFSRACQKLAVNAVACTEPVH